MTDEKELIEKWKCISINGNTMYSVSSSGNVKNNITDSIIKPKQVNGKLQVSLGHCSREEGRLITTAFVPNRKGLKYIKHKYGNLWNNKVKNLRWTTDEFYDLHTQLIYLNLPYRDKEHVRKLNCRFDSYRNKSMLFILPFYT